MIKINLGIRRGDGPYIHATPMTVNVGGKLITKTDEWLADDGAGHSFSMQVRSMEGDSGNLLFTVRDIKVADLNDQMHVFVTFWPEETALLPIIGPTPVGDVQLTRRGDRVDTIIAYEFNVIGDVTR